MSAWGWEDDTDSLGGGDWLEPGLDRAPAQRSGRRPGAGRSLRRLAVLVVSLPVLILVPVVGITSCGPPAGSAERGYLEELASPAAASQGIGRQLTSLLSGERTDAAGPVLARLATEAERNLVALDDVKPPGRLLATSRYAQQSLELRALALRTIVHLLDGTKGGPSVALLAAQGRRLLASDVIWHDLVQDATTRSLADAGIAGARVPGSLFLSDMRVVGADSFARFLAGGSTASLLELGDAGPTVRAWQRSLDVWRAKTTSPIAALTPDGSFGPTTQAATEALQASANLVPDGVVGAKTRRALAQALAGARAG